MLLLSLLFLVFVAAQPATRWVLVGTRALAYSNDGLTWTNVPVFPTGGGQAVAYSHEASEWIAVGSLGVSSTASIFNSSDGINWNAVANPFSGGGGNGIAYGQSQWIAVGSGTTNTIAHRPPLSGTWTGLGKTVFSTAGHGVAFSTSQSRWVAVGQGTNTIATSSDGFTWTGRGTTIFGSAGIAVTFSESQTRWVATGAGTNTLAHSTDGITWTGLGTTIFTSQGNGVAFSTTQSRWVAVGCCTTIMSVSSDGINWTPLNTQVFGTTGGQGFAIAFSPSQGLWTAVGQGSSSSIATSFDGANWNGIAGSTSIAFPGTGIAVADFPVSHTMAPAGGGGGGNSSSAAAPCFHKDTAITYGGHVYTFADIQKGHPECSIPHVVSSVGVALITKCAEGVEKTLRLTTGHLVYTQHGLRAAGELKPSQDTLFADIGETAGCQLIGVTKEKEEQEYFGLNCLNSQVLANGIKTSTFEKYHALPAFWMQVAGRVLGIQRASQIGDQIASWAQRMNII